jgi:hypothetical protein
VNYRANSRWNLKPWYSWFALVSRSTLMQDSYTLHSSYTNNNLWNSLNNLVEFISISFFTLQRRSTADMRAFPAQFFPSRHSFMPQHTSVLFFHILTIPRGHFSKCFLAKFSMYFLYSSYPSYNPVLSFKIYLFSSKTVGPLSVIPWLPLKHPHLSEDRAAKLPNPSGVVV